MSHRCFIFFPGVHCIGNNSHRNVPADFNMRLEILNLLVNQECNIQITFPHLFEPYALITSTIVYAGDCHGKAILEFYATTDDVIEDFTSLPIHTSVLSCARHNSTVYYQSGSTLRLVLKTSLASRTFLTFTGETVLSHS